MASEFDNDIEVIGWLALRGGLDVAYFLRLEGTERALVVAGIERGELRRVNEAKHLAGLLSQTGKGGGASGP